MSKIGTLQKLDLREGDVVECVNSASSISFNTGYRYNVFINSYGDMGVHDDGNSFIATSNSTFRIVSRATPDVDYNDGNWHEFSGSKKPAEIHDKSVIEYVWHDKGTGKAGVHTSISGYDNFYYSEPAWDHIIRLRVTTPHTEPRTIYLDTHDLSEVSEDHPNAAKFVEELK